MAFKIRNLSVLAYANGFTLWHYKTSEDTLPVITLSNYFIDGYDMLSVGDMIMVTAFDGGSVRMVNFVASDQVITRPLG